MVASGCGTPAAAAPWHRLQRRTRREFVASQRCQVGGWVGEREGEREMASHGDLSCCFWSRAWLEPDSYRKATS